MKIKKGFVVRAVGGENVVVPVGEMSKVFHGMINLNETGKFLWDFFTQEHTLQEAVEALCGEYDVSAEIAEEDAKRFMETLLQNKFAE
jgi:hypothetical protein